MSAEAKTGGKEICFLGTLDRTHGAWDRPDALCPRCRPTVEAGGRYHPEFMVEAVARVRVDPGNALKVFDVLRACYPERRGPGDPEIEGDPVAGPWSGDRGSALGKLGAEAGFGPEELQAAAEELARIEESREGRLAEMAAAARRVVNHAAGVLNQVSARLGQPQVSGTAELGLVYGNTHGLEHGDECPLCQCGTVEIDDTGAAACRGECGAIMRTAAEAGDDT